MEFSFESVSFIEELPRRQAAKPPLTPRERQVLGFLLTGASEKEVAARLDISQQTVHAHIKALYRACGVSSRPQLMARWLLDALRALRAAQQRPEQAQRCACAR